MTEVKTCFMCDTAPYTHHITIDHMVYCVCYPCLDTVIEFINVGKAFPARGV